MTEVKKMNLEKDGNELKLYFFTIQGGPIRIDLPEDFKAFQEALTGKADHEALAAANAKAIELIAAKRAKKLHEDWKKRDIPKETEAIRKQLAAEMLQTTPSPDMARGKTAGAFDPSKLEGAEFDAWYEKNVLSRR